ncbi:ABC transporter substrate-binding protein [Elioraea sp.]|uniref:ABC transporter substrate-binding protein n=1 Tax=Elioraea sp. TaxID=2185103 RepID=UPI0025C69B13|nr:ABC transporter substrate-binding protein [Elioraea sp.]
MIGRRGVLALPLLAAPALAQGQVRIGWVSVFPLRQVSAYLDAFREGLAALGYVEGRNLVLDAVSAEGDASRLPEVLDSLLRRRPAVIVAQGAAIFAAERVRTVPVVFGFSGDPVLAGLTDSLARPSRNLTGMTFMAVDLNEKRLDLLRELLPASRRVVLTGDPVHPGAELEVAASRAMAERLGIAARWVPTASRAMVRELLAELEINPPDALVVLPDSVMLQSRSDVAAFGVARRTPTMSGWRIFAESGGLVSYGPHLETSFQRLAHYAVRLLAGARPAELPVERPTRFELVLNRRTAEAIRLDLPLALLARADEVLE